MCNYPPPIKKVCMTMKKSLIAAALAIVPLCVQAQRIYVDGFIYDSFTGEKLDSVNVVFMRPDSTVAQRFVSEKIWLVAVCEHVGGSGQVHYSVFQGGV